MLIGLAAVTRFQIAPVAVSEWDSWGWLNPALSWLGGLGFREQFEREWLYGAFIAACLRLTGSFSGFVFIQQVLGLVAGVLMWLTWRTWATLFPKDSLFEIASVILGLFVVAVYLFSPIAIALELAIRPEGIMAFVAFLQLYCITSYCKFRWHTPRLMASTVFGALAIPLAYSLFVLKPNWLLAVLVTTLPVFAGVFGTAAPLMVRLLTPVLGLILILATLLLPERALFVPTAETRVVLPMTLFTIHADVIQEDLQRQFASQATLGKPTALSRGISSGFRARDADGQNTGEILPATRVRSGLPDVSFPRVSLPGKHACSCRDGRSQISVAPVSCLRSGINLSDMPERSLSSSVTSFSRMTRRFSASALKSENSTTTSARQCPTRSTRHSASLSGDLYQTYRENVVARAGQPASLEVFRPFVPFLRALAAGAFYIEIAFFASLAACLILKSLARFRLPGLIALMFFLAPAGNALTVALIHALDNSRYRGSYGPLLLFALAGFVLFFLTTLAHAVAHLKEHRAQIVRPD